LPLRHKDTKDFTAEFLDTDLHRINTVLIIAAKKPALSEVEGAQKKHKI
jgi:hypothetical protein